jgi:N-acetylmuramoyl-L-alanine amidase
MHRRRGWSEIGYHYLITLDGKVYAGRRPDESVGAHVGGFNNRTLGIAYVGGLRSSDAKPMDTRRPEQTANMEKLCRTLLTRFPKAVILGHRDLSPDLDGDDEIEPHEWMKQCPCFNAGPWAKSVGLPGGKYVRGEFVKL